MSDEGIKKKKDRDPIFATCFVVFVIACVAVLGSYVYSEFVEADDTKVAYGDTVTVNYTGSFYAYYGEDNAVVFDTSLTSVDESDCAKSNTYDASAGSTIEVIVGDGDYLALFENCLVGHQVGDSVRVTIPVGEGYVAPGSSSHTVSTAIEFSIVETMTETAFSDMYGIDLTGGQTVTFTTIYGWSATATYSTATNMVVITNMPVAEQTYTYGLSDDEESGITLTVGGSVSDTFTATVDFGDVTVVDEETGEIQMVEFVIGGQTVYVTNLDGEEFTYKTCDEVYNITLYFVIEIVSIE